MKIQIAQFITTHHHFISFKREKRMSDNRVSREVAEKSTLYFDYYTFHNLQTNFFLRDGSTCDRNFF